jgi:hypothetical protein
MTLKEFLKMMKKDNWEIFEKSNSGLFFFRKTKSGLYDKLYINTDEFKQNTKKTVNL